KVHQEKECLIMKILFLSETCIKRKSCMYLKHTINITKEKLHSELLKKYGKEKLLKIYHIMYTQKKIKNGIILRDSQDQVVKMVVLCLTKKKLLILDN